MEKNYSVYVSSPPITLPITASELRRHGRIDDFEGETAPQSLTATATMDAGNLSIGSYSYRVTFVTDQGETEGGDISNTVTLTDAYTIYLTDLPIGGFLVKKRKIYRTEADDSTYKLVTTIDDNTTTEYTDDIADASLTTEVPTENTTEDLLLTSLIMASTEYIENILRRKIITQTLVFRFDQLKHYYELPYGNLQSVESIKYYDLNNTLQTLDPSLYIVDTYSVPPRVTTAPDINLPETYNSINNTQIECIFGYGDTAASIPMPIRHAILMFASHLYENRESVSDLKLVEVPMGVNTLIAPYRILDF